MRIQNNTSLNFKAGLTESMRREMRGCDVKRISNELWKNGIQTDLKDNKIAAWCILKTFEIAKRMNLGFPKGIFVEYFSKLKCQDVSSLAFCNIAPALIYRDKNTLAKDNTLFFNENVDWSYIDCIADETFAKGDNSTDFFLGIFLHEFAHSMHENNLLKKMNIENLLLKISNMQKTNINKQFHDKFDHILSQICDYAKASPFEAIACDLTKRMVNNINKNTLAINSDFIKNSPYREPKIFDFRFGEDELSKTIRNFWNGKF